MAFSFSAFRNLVNSDDLFRANRAELIINKRPAGMSASSIAGASFVGAGGRLSFLIDSFSIPGVSWASSDNIRRYGYGILESRPYTPVFNELPITIMGDRKMEVYKYFHEWTNLVVNYNFLGGGGIGGSYLNGLRTYEVGYKDSYATEASVVVYSMSGEIVAIFEMRDVYPYQLDTLPMNWATNDEIARIGVTLKLTDWHLKF